MKKYLIFSVTVLSLELDISTCISCRTAFRDEPVQKILKSDSLSRFYCPPNCANPLVVEGTTYYSYRSTACGAAVHAGAIEQNIGGFFDVLKVEDFFGSNKELNGSAQNGIISKSIEEKGLIPIPRNDYQYDMVYQISPPTVLYSKVFEKF